MIGGGSNVMPQSSNLKCVPIVGEASCGLPILNSYQDDEVVYISENDYKKGLYAVIASGDSMTPEINDSDRVVCDPTAEIISGDLVHYKFYNDSAIKVYFRDENKGITQFIPYNNTADFKTVTVLDDDKEMLENLTIAKVVHITRVIDDGRKQRLRLLGKCNFKRSRNSNWQ